jgi:hypothetical protein
MTEKTNGGIILLTSNSSGGEFKIANLWIVMSLDKTSMGGGGGGGAKGVFLNLIFQNNTTKLY